ncbi:MAG: hypothetical protein LBJ32_03565 [Oscillospiraceae bacterium]|nr:hypothetical protein [Oscillospiraceae bacterium]
MDQKRRKSFDAEKKKSPNLIKMVASKVTEIAGKYGNYSNFFDYEFSDKTIVGFYIQNFSQNNKLEFIAIIPTDNLRLAILQFYGLSENKRESYLNRKFEFIRPIYPDGTVEKDFFISAIHKNGNFPEESTVKRFEESFLKKYNGEISYLGDYDVKMGIASTNGQAVSRFIRIFKVSDPLTPHIDDDILDGHISSSFNFTVSGLYFNPLDENFEYSGKFLLEIGKGLPQIPAGSIFPYSEHIQKDRKNINFELYNSFIPRIYGIFH